jgi:hypothetical protein
MADRASELRRVEVSGGGAGTYTLVAGEAGYRVSVVGAVLSASAASQVTLQDTSAALLSLYLAANSVVSIPEMTGGWLTTISGQRLDIVVVAAATVRGVLIYRMIPDHARY